MHWCTIYSARTKLQIWHSTRIHLRQVDGDEAQDFDEHLLLCVDILERIQYLRADADCQRWAWLWQNCTEWDASTVALSTIAAGNCSSEVVQRAWRAIDCFFAAWVDNLGDPAHRRRWRELKTFRDWVQATEVREVLER